MRGSSVRWRVARVVVIWASFALIGLSAVGAAADPIVPPWRFDLPWQTDTMTIEVGDASLVVELADTPVLQSKGLGYRDRLDVGTGMLFVYDDAAERSFWMKGMRFCLDIIWINDGQIVGAAESVCPVPGASDEELPSHASPEPVTYVLEVPAGWMAEHGFGPGTPVEIDPTEEQTSG